MIGDWVLVNHGGEASICNWEFRRLQSQLKGINGGGWKLLATKLIWWLGPWILWGCTDLVNRVMAWSSQRFGGGKLGGHRVGGWLVGCDMSYFLLILRYTKHLKIFLTKNILQQNNRPLKSINFFFLQDKSACIIYVLLLPFFILMNGHPWPYKLNSQIIINNWKKPMALSWVPVWYR